MGIHGPTSRHHTRVDTSSSLRFLALSGNPLGTGPLNLEADGTLEARFEAVWVDGPPIEHFYILGLAYFYMAECEKSYPLFDAALQIDPEETNALEGIRLCREHED